MKCCIYIKLYTKGWRDSSVSKSILCKDAVQGEPEVKSQVCACNPVLGVCGK